MVLTLLTAFLAFGIYMMIAERKVGDIKQVMVFGLLMLCSRASPRCRSGTGRAHPLLRPFGERKMTRALKRLRAPEPRPGGERLHPVGPQLQAEPAHHDPVAAAGRRPRPPVHILIGPLMGHSAHRLGQARGQVPQARTASVAPVQPCLLVVHVGQPGLQHRSSDPWWQMCIHMLMHSCEIIVVDLSKVKAGTAWELEQLHAKAILDKCVFVVGEEHIADVGMSSSDTFPPGPAANGLMSTATRAIIKAREYDAHFGQVMEAGLAG